MSLILQIETATTSCSIALAENGQVLAARELNERNVHAEVVTVFTQEVVKEAGKTMDQLDAVAVSSGPGSYTGLRIGVSTAKGLCYALDKPLIAIETLEAMAAGFKAGYAGLTENTLLCPMIDARRMEVYTALFDSNGSRVTPTSAEIIDENSFANFLAAQQVIFFGDGASKCKAVLAHQPNAVIVDDFINSAKYLTEGALKRFNEGRFEDVAYFEPFYLKDFIAGKKAL